MISAWSYSKLVIYEQCPFRARLQYIDRIPEPPRSAPKGKAEHPLDRGIRVHEAAELFVQGGVELIPELLKFSDEFAKLQTLYKDGKVSLEGDWGVRRDWGATAWTSSDIWGRAKLDAFVTVSDTVATVIDYKTGKKYGNEVKHGEQGQLYMLAAHGRQPHLESINVEFWYTDQDDVTSVTYRSSAVPRFRSKFERRFDVMLSDTEFKPRPNVISCKWCPYRTEETGGGGNCPHSFNPIIVK